MAWGTTPLCWGVRECLVLSPATEVLSDHLLGVMHNTFLHRLIFHMCNQGQGMLHNKALNSATWFLAVKREKKIWSFIQFILKGFNHLSQN